MTSNDAAVHGATPGAARLLLALAQGRHGALIAMTDGLRSNPRSRADEQAWLARAAALCATGRVAPAMALFDEWLPRLADDRFEASPQVAAWRARAGLCALAAGRRQQARDASARAGAALARQPGFAPHDLLPITELRRRLDDRKSARAVAMVVPRPSDRSRGASDR